MAEGGKRIALRVEYDGAAFGGWQRQSSPSIPTVQASLESAISRIADAPVRLVCAGRTDAGVHATCQVVHFDSPRDRGARAWRLGVNSFLPDSVRVREVFPAADSFSARFSALYRRYIYLLHCGADDSALLAGRVAREPAALDLEAMGRGARHLLGELDFSSFRASGCQSASAVRSLDWLAVYEQRGFVVIDVRANAFLQRMVRNIAGSLLEVGRGARGPDWIRQLLRGKDRTAAAATAPAAGLYLVSVGYPDGCGVPSRAIAPPILDQLPQID